MKTKLCRPVLVETKEKSTIFLSDDKTTVSTMPYEVESPNAVRLILVSLDPDESIEVENVAYFGGQIISVESLEDDCVIFINPLDNEYQKISGINRFKKVIATHSQLSPEPEKYISAGGQGGQISVHWRKWNNNKLPLIPEAYIQQFIEEYNKSEKTYITNPFTNKQETCFVGKIKDVEIEMELDGLYMGHFEGVDCSDYKPKLINGFVTIVEKDSEKLEDGWEARLAVKNIPELSHVINSLSELRRYYIDGIQIGYNMGKSELDKDKSPATYTEGEAKELAYRILYLSTPPAYIEFADRKSFERLWDELINKKN